MGIGQFINISTGCAGLLLVMCGHEKLQGYISFSFIGVNLFLNYFFIITYGAIGAAIATAIAIGGENLTRVYFVKKKIGILTLPVVL